MKVKLTEEFIEQTTEDPPSRNLNQYRNFFNTLMQNKK